MIKVKMEDIVMKFSLKASGFVSNNYKSTDEPDFS